MITDERLKELVAFKINFSIEGREKTLMDSVPVSEMASELLTLREKYTIRVLENAKGSLRLDELHREIDTLRQQNKDLIEAIESVRKLDHCVFYDSALSVLKESNPKLAKLIFDTRPEWDFTKWEDV